MPHGITQCYLPPGRGDIPPLPPAEAGTRLSDPGGMQGWVDLGETVPFSHGRRLHAGDGGDDAATAKNLWGVGGATPLFSPTRASDGQIPPWHCIAKLIGDTHASGPRTGREFRAIGPATENARQLNKC